MSQFLVKVVAIIGLIPFSLVYFFVNFSVIFTRLILGLRSLRTFKTFLLISYVITQLNLTNFWLIWTVYLSLFLYEGFLSHQVQLQMPLAQQKYYH